MREILLEKAAKEVLIKEFGKEAIKIDGDLNKLAKLIIKRKDHIKAFNRGNFKAKAAYMQLDKEIKLIIAEINNKLLM